MQVPLPRAASTSAEPSLAEQAFVRLRRDVLTGAHAPGAKLKVEELQGSYGYSSSPLREALNRLSQEGLIRADDRRGFRVAAISRADLADVTHMRLLLDVQALRASMEHGDDAWEAAVVAAAHRLEKAEAQLGDGPTVLDDAWSQVHREFHLSLLAACPSERQRTLCASLFDQAERYRRFSARHRVTAKSKHREHRRLLDAVLKHDIDTACALLAEHIRGTQRNVEAALQRMEAAAG
jgi:DNA-binding GntR family transcriptional regulator